MDFGMPTLLETKNIDECALLCANLGLKFIELSMNLPEYQVNKLNVNRLSAIADKYGLYYTIHLEEKLSPCDFNERIAAAYTQTVLDVIELAKQLNVRILNMHLSEGVYFTLPNSRKFLYDEYYDIYVEKLLSFRESCEEKIGDKDIKICIENTVGYNRQPFLKKSLDILLESQTFALTFDIGHNACIGFSDEPIINDYLDKLMHMHVHDAKAAGNHLALGDGELDLINYIDMAIRNNCRMVIETKTVDALKQSVKWLKAKYAPLLQV